MAVAGAARIPSVGTAKPFAELARQDVAVLRATSRRAAGALCEAWRRASRFHSVPVGTLAMASPLSWGIAGQGPVFPPPSRTHVPEECPFTGVARGDELPR